MNVLSQLSSQLGDRTELAAIGIDGARPADLTHSWLPGRQTPA